MSSQKKLRRKANSKRSRDAKPPKSASKELNSPSLAGIPRPPYHRGLQDSMNLNESQNHQISILEGKNDITALSRSGKKRGDSYHHEREQSMNLNYMKKALISRINFFNFLTF